MLLLLWEHNRDARQAPAQPGCGLAGRSGRAAAEPRAGPCASKTRGLDTPAAGNQNVPAWRTASGSWGFWSRALRALSSASEITRDLGRLARPLAWRYVVRISAITLMTEGRAD